MLLQKIKAIVKVILKTILIPLRNKLVVFVYNIQKRDIIEVQLVGGLCNKLYCLFAAVEIAQNKNYKILEPEFGWREKILFSDIYDIEYFNQNFNNIIVPRSDLKEREIKKRVRFKKYEKIDLWQFSEKNFAYMRNNKVIDTNSVMIKALKVLKLKNEYNDIISNNANHNIAIQIRIESDWQRVAKNILIPENQIFLINPIDLIATLKDFTSIKDIFFTTGENQEEIKSLFSENGFKSSYFYNENLEYEINAAINFEILVQANIFIGMTRSTYTNLISMKRRLLLGNSENYIYNFKNKFVKRIDYGLFTNARDSITIKPGIIGG